MEQDLTYISQWKIPFGKYRNMTYEELIIKDTKYVCWLLKNNIINNDKVKSFLTQQMETK